MTAKSEPTIPAAALGTTVYLRGVIDPVTGARSLEGRDPATGDYAPADVVDELITNLYVLLDWQAGKL